VYYFTPPVESIVGAWSRIEPTFKGWGRESACGLVRVGGGGLGGDAQTWQGREPEKMLLLFG